MASSALRPGSFATTLGDVLRVVACVTRKETVTPSGVAFAPQVTAQWNLYVHRRWSVFPEVGMAVFFVSDQYWYHDAPYRRGRRAFVDGVFAFGARRHFTDRIAVTMRLGWPFGAQAGVTF